MMSTYTATWFLFAPGTPAPEEGISAVQNLLTDRGFSVGRVTRTLGTAVASSIIHEAPGGIPDQGLTVQIASSLPDARGGGAWPVGDPERPPLEGAALVSALDALRDKLKRISSVVKIEVTFTSARPLSETRGLSSWLTAVAGPRFPTLQVLGSSGVRVRAISAPNYWAWGLGIAAVLGAGYYFSK